MTDLPLDAPPLLTDVEAAGLARRLFAGACVYRLGRACVVSSHAFLTAEILGFGETWERAFDCALRNDGR